MIHTWDLARAGARITVKAKVCEGHHYCMVLSTSPFSGKVDAPSAPTAPVSISVEVQSRQPAGGRTREGVHPQSGSNIRLGSEGGSC